MYSPTELCGARTQKVEIGADFLSPTVVHPVVCRDLMDKMNCEIAVLIVS
jgi:hypothetical protein